MRIVFTRHAEDKFAILRRHGVHVTRESVVAAVRHPTHIDHSRVPLLIAQHPLDRTHVLRVVYHRIGHTRKIITFYPGRISQYGR